MFADLASAKTNQVEKPQPIPVGHYTARFAGPFTRRDANTGNYAMRFPISLTEAHDDVDSEKLAKAKKWNERKINIDFWMNVEAQYRFTEFAQALGLDTTSDEATILSIAEQLIENMPEFMVEIGHRADDKDPSVLYTEVLNYTALPA
jgi:hypothetical protein